MKNILPAKFPVWILFFLGFVPQLSFSQNNQQAVIHLGYPPQTGAPSCYQGSVNLTPRDQYESGIFNFSATGPIYYIINGNLNPATVSAGQLTAKVCVDTNSPYFPLPGDSASATLSCHYSITYSSPLSPLYAPHGGPSATGVHQSTGAVWSCKGSTTDPCFAGHTAPSSHTLVTETGTIPVFFQAQNFRPRVLGGNDMIYRLMRERNGAFEASPLTGAPNSSQKGARIPTSVQANNPFDITPNPNNANGNVGPGISGTDGLSASVNQPAAAGNRVVGRVSVANLPAGLAARQDNQNGHVSIYPTRVMTFSQYQQLLNSIPWVKVP